MFVGEIMSNNDKNLKDIENEAAEALKDPKFRQDDFAVKVAKFVEDMARKTRQGRN